MNPETWRKRRADIHILNDFFEDQKIDLDKLRQMRADVTLVNALTWLNGKGGNRCLQDLRKLKMHGGIALAMFFNIDDVSKSPIVTSAAKKFELAIRSKSKYATMCDQDKLLSFIVAQQEVNGWRLMDMTIAFIVAFTAARMMELTRMLIGEINIDEDKMIIKIKVKKGKKEIEYNVEVSKQKGKNCPVKAMINWLKDDECMKRKQDRFVGIDQQYGGATVLHVMMTKLKKYGATQEEVNAFTRHAPGSNVIDVYYNKPVGRDLSTLLLSGGDF
ncbi:MAG: hypothetical protein EZS28_024443 [Streblomastix strix]|uniref:Tyr recombinase domain-containing protein n=1 Tax=Streblomastix strix TaxID=222440 RepID=A0A5J4VC70_9EUKA|nr:MAG: hypothetical protein EZS28_024443 [Streblomastix strix]